MPERDTGDLMRVLYGDWNESYALLLSKVEQGVPEPDGTISVDSDFASRQLIRTGFALVEGLAYALKIEAMFNAQANGVVLAPHEHHFILEADFRLNDKGDVVQCDARIPLVQNVRFALQVLERANRLDPIFDSRAQWWSDFRRSVHVRNRLMHPRWPEDLDVTARETIAMARAVTGLQETVTAILSARPVSTQEA